MFILQYCVYVLRLEFPCVQMYEMKGSGRTNPMSNSLST